MSTFRTRSGTERGVARAVVVVGIAGLVGLAAVVVFAVTRGDETPAPAAAPANTPAAGAVTELSTGRAIAAKCMVPTVEMARSQTLAFEGVVTGIEDGLVTLDPSRFFRGTPTASVTVNQPDQAMSESPVAFEVGKAYIVGATDGVVSICGLSGPAEGDRLALYESAFR